MFGESSKVYTLTLVAATIFAGAGVSAQFIDEECHQECNVIYCDGLYDYCDYDCYEVCYPFRAYMRKMTAPAAATTPTKAQLQRVGAANVRAPNIQPSNTRISTSEESKTTRRRISKATTTQRSSPSNHNSRWSAGEQNSGAIKPKIMRLMIQAPSYQVTRRGEISTTKGALPKGLAVFHTACVSSGDEHRSGADDKPAPGRNEQVPLKQQQNSTTTPAASTETSDDFYE